ncbi:MAG: 2Fe-2S iron-sulfur cluster-binding protein [Chitinophagales bacterium]|nr:2Fe-2S iron-sulfur cluster binding domain-containing protein [Bacteroidota bacterium]MCB9042265.1 2Fe-2S iron-sulfur cluster binding domain-containing protein [Chitinophagales bacterium]
MSSQFYPLTVTAIKKLTPTSVALYLLPNADAAHNFSYTQGQYLTFKAQLNGSEVRRSYSLCSSPATATALCVGIKQVPNGVFSTYACTQLKVGDVLETQTPTGNFFTKLDSSQQKKYVGIAAGSGITPILSILKTSLVTELQSSFTLLYANKCADEIMFKEELADLATKFPQRFKVHYLFSQEKTADPLFSGRINAEKFLQLGQKDNNLLEADDYFLCGPYDMIQNLQTCFTDLGKTKNQVHFELFTTPVSAEEEAKPSPQASFESEVSVVIDDIEYNFTMPNEGTSILDAAIEAGADAPFSCKGAVCCTCRAKVMEGSIRMEKNYALSEDEVAEGFVLACQSHPNSEKVVLSFDE